MRRRHSRGFTLIELIVATVIIAILASIAIPSYQGYIARSNRTAAKSFMTEIASRQESFLADRKVYATSLTGLGYAADTMFLIPGGNTTGTTSSDVLYSVTLSGATTTAFSIVATPQGVQATRDAECTSLTLQSNGQKSATGDGASSCWG